MKKVLGTNMMILTFLLLFFAVGGTFLEHSKEKERLNRLESNGYATTGMVEFEIIKQGRQMLSPASTISYIVAEHEGFKVRVTGVGGKVGDKINLEAKRFYSKDGKLEELILK